MNVDIEIIPGVSAITTAMVLSNFDTYFKFIGFLKPKTIQRQNQLKKLIKGTYVYFASPHRIIKELEDIKTVFGNIEICILREMTKKFETIYRGMVEETISKISKNIKGEYTIVFEIKKDII